MKEIKYLMDKAQEEIDNAFAYTEKTISKTNILNAMYHMGAYHTYINLLIELDEKNNFDNLVEIHSQHDKKINIITSFMDKLYTEEL
jgi:topoisomerase IA-like protein